MPNGMHNKLLTSCYCRVAGMVGRRPFTSENVLVQGLDQEVTGQKVFVHDKGLSTLQVTYLNIEGLLNDLDFGDFCTGIVSNDSNYLSWKLTLICIVDLQRWSYWVYGVQKHQWSNYYQICKHQWTLPWNQCIILASKTTGKWDYERHGRNVPSTHGGCTNSWTKFKM